MQLRSIHMQSKQEAPIFAKFTRSMLQIDSKSMFKVSAQRNRRETLNTL